jgi:hypothetical protein
MAGANFYACKPVAAEHLLEIASLLAGGVGT